MAVYETGPAATAMERAVLAFFARALGLPDTAGGVLTSGGSLGNLTALLAARQARPGLDVWRRGLRGGPQLVVFVGETAHYSLARACRILGVGDAGCVSVPCDERLRMDPRALDDAIAAAVKKKHAPIAVVASAGSTTAGAIDPLDAIADVCAARGVWLHVDGAQGGVLALSPALRPRLAGIERADSVVLDAHKMMAMPALATVVLFRDAAAGAAAFAQEAGYLFQDGDDDAWSDVGRRTVECTKRMISLKLYACLQAYGPAFFARHVERVCALAAFLADEARRRGFDVLVEPEMDIVCFRPRGLDGGQVAAVRKRVLDDGRFYLVSVRRPDGLWLRTTILHPLTTDDDLRALLDEVEAAAYGPRPEAPS
jgi:L-2,4-diaminobutyrate decarboxylase